MQLEQSWPTTDIDFYLTQLLFFTIKRRKEDVEIKNKKN